MGDQGFAELAKSIVKASGEAEQKESVLTFRK